MVRISKGARVLAVAGALVLCAGIGPGRAGQTITVTNYGEMEPVVFDHTSHSETYGCELCHHPEKSEGAHRCGACHMGEAKGDRMGLEEAAHGEGVGRCWKCHLSDNPRKKLDCEDCHRG